MKTLKIITNLLIKKSILAASILLVAILISCDPTDALKLDNSCGDNWSKEVQDEVNAYNKALNAYGADPTTQNCNEVKKTGNKYIDALKGVEKCVPTVSKKDWEKALEESRKQLNELSCE